MSITPATIWGPIQLAASAAILGNVVSPSGLQVIKRAVFTNTDNIAVSITVYVVRSGGTATTATEIISGLVLSAGQDYPSPELNFMVLNPGDAIWASASVANVVNTTASGFQQ